MATLYEYEVRRPNQSQAEGPWRFVAHSIKINSGCIVFYEYDDVTGWNVTASLADGLWTAVVRKELDK